MPRVDTGTDACSFVHRTSPVRRSLRDDDQAALRRRTAGDDEARQHRERGHTGCRPAGHDVTVAGSDDDDAAAVAGDELGRVDPVLDVRVGDEADRVQAVPLAAADRHSSRGQDRVGVRVQQRRRPASRAGALVERHEPLRAVGAVDQADHRAVRDDPVREQVVRRRTPATTGRRPTPGPTTRHPADRSAGLSRRARGRRCRPARRGARRRGRRRMRLPTTIGRGGATSGHRRPRRAARSAAASPHPRASWSTITTLHAGVSSSASRATTVSQVSSPSSFPPGSSTSSRTVQPSASGVISHVR